MPLAAAGDDGDFVFVTFGHVFPCETFLIVIPGEAPTGPREARPDDELRAETRNP